MYQHNLLPTDGSALSGQAIRNGVAFAESLGARVTGLYVVPNTQVAAGLLLGSEAMHVLTHRKVPVLVYR